MTVQEKRITYYLVRHGTTKWNVEGRMQGHTDVPLSPAGIEQAERVANRICSLPIPPQIVWSSDLERAEHTARLTASKLDAELYTTPLLREVMLGEWEGLTQDEIIQRGDGTLLELYRNNPYYHRPPGGESLDAVWARMMDVQRQIRSNMISGSVVIVGHGGCLRAIICAALQSPVASMHRIWLDNASLTTIEEVDRNGLLSTRLTLMNDVSHLV